MSDSLLPTIIVGVIIFIISQYMLKLVIEPIKSLKELMSEISFTLLLHRRAITDVSENSEAYSDLKKLPSKLYSCANTLPFYDFWHSLQVFQIPSKESLLKASRELNALTYAVSRAPSETKRGELGHTANFDRLKRIGELLLIDTSYR